MVGCYLATECNSHLGVCVDAMTPDERRVMWWNAITWVRNYKFDIVLVALYMAMCGVMGLTIASKVCVA